MRSDLSSNPIFDFLVKYNRADNAQVTQWRGCYDDICEYRRTEAISNSPEFAKKKRESVVT